MQSLVLGKYTLQYSDFGELHSLSVHFRHLGRSGGKTLLLQLFSSQKSQELPEHKVVFVKHPRLVYHPGASVVLSDENYFVKLFWNHFN